MPLQSTLTITFYRNATRLGRVFIVSLSVVTRHFHSDSVTIVNACSCSVCSPARHRDILSHVRIVPLTIYMHTSVSQHTCITRMSESKPMTLVIVQYRTTSSGNTSPQIGLRNNILLSCTEINVTEKTFKHCQNNMPAFYLINIT